MLKKKEEKTAKKEEKKAKKAEKAAAKEAKKEEKQKTKEEKRIAKAKKAVEDMRKAGFSEEEIEEAMQNAEKSVWQVWSETAEEQSRCVKLEYLGGHPEINPGKVWLEPSKKQNSLKVRDEELEVTSLSWGEKGKRSIGKAAAGALVGGALTAGAGAVVGAAIGGRKKDNSVAIMTVKDGAVEHTLYFRCNKDEYQKVAALLK
ncbi:hypothetical protein [Shouchella tritolerans]|uniref:hypothetical protein n=1 Tax=Shouchella tritolerans TaxID=2979466 RepID=UPI0021E94848|nr:hypothetical protein [Shouchella tritolerans]